MADRYLIIDPDTMSGDVVMDDRGHIALTDGLYSTVAISLFTDKRARSDDRLPDNTGDRRGWALTWRQDDGSREIGSWLWLLSREKQLATVMERARGYGQDALKWLITTNRVRSVAVTVENSRPGWLILGVEAVRLDGTTWTAAYDYYWGPHGA